MVAKCDVEVDKQWRREDDARTLLNAQEIRMDKTRYASARKELAAIVERADREALAKRAQAKLEKAIKE